MKAPLARALRPNAMRLMRRIRHSAGGHLTAMALGHPVVAAGLAISGVYDLAPIRDTALNSEQENYVEGVQNSAEILLGMINDILDVSKIEAGKLDLELAELHPIELITTVFEVVAPKFSIRSGHRYIISVGSVGQPRDYDNRASYTIYDTDEKTFEFKRVAYDIEAAANKIYAAELERNFGNRLFLGV